MLPDADTKEMMKIASQLMEEGFLTLLIGERGKRASVVSSVPAYLKAEISASELVKRVCEVLGGSGGGKAEIAQGGGVENRKRGRGNKRRDKANPRPTKVSIAKKKK